MIELRHLFSPRNRDSEWQRMVVARLDSLAESQDDLGAMLRSLAESQIGIRKELADHAEEGQPTPRGRRREFILLGISITLVLTSVSATIIAPTYQDRATAAFDQAQATLGQVNSAFQPVETIVAKHGPEYIYTHPSKAVFNDIEVTQKYAEQYAKYNAQGNDFDNKYVTSAYFGQAILAIGSALFGAIMGLMLIPMVTKRRKQEVDNAGVEQNQASKPG